MFHLKPPVVARRVQLALGKHLQGGASVGIPLLTRAELHPDWGASPHGGSWWSAPSWRDWGSEVRGENPWTLSAVNGAE